MIPGANIDSLDSNFKCLIHLDRLSLTFKLYSGSTFIDIRNPDNIPQEQVYNKITLIHDKSPGLGAYYHSFKVFFEGLFIGRLHTSPKLVKQELQFDFEKEVFYSFYPTFWYEIYCALNVELGILYNNIKYVEIDVDTNKNLVGHFGYYYQNTINNKLHSGDRYKMGAKTSVNVMNNGALFLIEGTDNAISIYNKSSHADDFIHKYFSNNGLGDGGVYRIESKLTWNYIRSIRNRKKMDINVETLTDCKKLAKIFLISTENKITFKDTLSKTIDKNRNSHYKRISIIDDLPIETSEIGRLNPVFCKSHYISKAIDENIMRQNYYMFLDSGNKKYLKNFRYSSSVAGLNNVKMINAIIKLNKKYNGNRTDEIKQRMEYAIRSISRKFSIKMNRRVHKMIIKLKLTLLGLF